MPENLFAPKVSSILVCIISELPLLRDKHIFIFLGSVSSWGESAGGSSLLSHLIVEGRKLNPLFQRGLLQSPSFIVNANFEVNYKVFRDFAAAAQCLPKGQDEPQAQEGSSPSHMMRLCASCK